MARIVAHRGLSSEFPENTLKAFREAVKAGFREIEMDVQLTRDGEVIVLHDETVDRTTDGKGPAYAMDWSDIRRLKSGSERIPRLDDVFDALRGEDVFFRVELKTVEAALPAMSVIKKHRMMDRVMISSFSVHALREIRDRYADIPMGLLILKPIRAKDLILAKTLRCSEIQPSRRFASPRKVKYLTKLGYSVTLWTVNNLIQAKTYVDRGAVGIITDRREVLESLRD